MGKKNKSGAAHRRGKHGGRGPTGRGKFASKTDDRRPGSSVDQDHSDKEHENVDGENPVIYLIVHPVTEPWEEVYKSITIEVPVAMWVRLNLNFQLEQF